MNKIKIYFLISTICFYTKEYNITKNFKELFLNGTFVINSIYNNSSYFGFKNKKVILSNSEKREFAIFKIYQNKYILQSRLLNKILGVDKNNKEDIIFYDKKKIDKKNFIPELVIWNLINLKDNQFFVKNSYNKKFLRFNNFSLIFDDLIYDNILIKSYDNKFLFRFLKLYEENTYDNNEIINNEPIDVFIKYIDLNDKSLKREGINQIYKDFDNQELKYSLRSIFKYIPWIRKIFILFPNKKISFLKAYPQIKNRIVYVNDKDFLGFDSANIFAFSFNLHKMEKFGISKNFIYMEDDYFIGKPMKKSDFFYYNEQKKKIVPYLINTNYWELEKSNILNSYENLYKEHRDIKPHSGKGWDLSIMSTNKYFFEKYNKTSIINALFTHSAIPENIDDLKEIFSEIKNYKYINETLFSKTRHVLTLNQPHFHNLYLLNIKGRKVHKIPNRYIDMENLEENLTYIPLFVINTCGNNIPSNSDYINARKIMEKRFPNKTEFELNDNINVNYFDLLYFKKSNQTRFFDIKKIFVQVLLIILIILKLKIK